MPYYREIEIKWKQVTSELRRDCKRVKVVGNKIWYIILNSYGTLYEDIMLW